MAPTAAKPATTGTKKVKSGKPINSELKSSGVMRLSRGRMFHKRGLWHIAKWQKSQKPAERKTRTRVVKKEVKGEKNGKSRSVRVGKFVSALFRPPWNGTGEQKLRYDRIPICAQFAKRK